MTLEPYPSRGRQDAEAASLAEYGPDRALLAALAVRVPSIANCGIPEDRASVTWTLREAVAWSDGTPFAANGVVSTWRLCAASWGGCASASRFR